MMIIHITGKITNKMSSRGNQKNAKKIHDHHGTAIRMKTATEHCLLLARMNVSINWNFRNSAKHNGEVLTS